MATGTLEQLFVAFVKPEQFGDYFVYLVNNTVVDYARVATFTGMHASVDDGLLESTRARQERGELRAHSAILIEDGDWHLLDFVIWYDVDLFPADAARPPERFSFSFGGLSFALGQRDATFLPVLDRDGWVIEIKARPK
jgi:hypothetical protein